MFVNKLFTYLTAHILKSKRCFNAKSLTHYFHMKTKNILADFQICINVPLISQKLISGGIKVTKQNPNGHNLKKRGGGGH